MKKYLIYLGLFAAVGIGLVYYYTQRDSRNDIKYRKAEESISALALFEAFEEDEEGALERFLGKTVLVSGEIHSLDLSPEKATIVLDTGDPLSTIVCEMNHNLQSDFGMLSEGQSVEVKGECSGKLMDIILVNCILIN